MCFFFNRGRVSEELLRLIHVDLHKLLHKVDIIMGTQADAIVQFDALTEQVERNRLEVLDAIANLPPPNEQPTSPEFDAALARLVAKVQQSDDDVKPPVTP